ncbi:hypothetical protein OSB04_000971 [Centaurea solstitialis]|uniref:Uncharacterized protein n=1 Tax=Centaurea solstitialis TaxID=347529 RepID=A0AA38TQ52_9ASTR|nr:hypothetical protein OSB04_000971 [Centaurea solstitialis]
MDDCDGIGALRYQPVLDLLDAIREKIMKRFDKKRRGVKKGMAHWFPWPRVIPITSLRSQVRALQGTFPQVNLGELWCWKGRRLWAARVT